MTAKRTFKSDAFEAIHSSASAMLKVGAMDKATMRHFDETCLTTPTAFAPVDALSYRQKFKRGGC